MNRIFIAAILCLPLALTSPSVSQVSVQINIGNPAVRPWPDAIWVPGYYVVQPVTHVRVWHGGDWRHDNGHHYGQRKFKGGGKHGNGNGHDKEHGKERE